MDITAIQEAIEELESAETTIGNVQELANLYIVINEWKKHNLDGDSSVESPKTILPQYIKYCDAKRKYQVGEVAEDIIIKSIKCVCAELQQLVQSLYSNTDFNKERIEIRSMVQHLFNQYCTQ